MPKQQWEEKTRHPPTESSISVPEIPPRTCAFLRHRKREGDGGEGGRGERRGGRTDDDDIRFCAYTHCRRLDRLPPSPPHLSSPLFCLCPSSRPPPPPPFLFLFLRSIPLDSFLTLTMGRPIATSADSALLRLPTYLFPIYLVVRGQGEPDLSPLNGINKLYYACTSP